MAINPIPGHPVVSVKIGTTSIRTKNFIYRAPQSISMVGRKMPRNYEPIDNPTGTSVLVQTEVRNKIARIARAQNRGISEVSIELSDLWLRELDKRYPQL